MIFKILQLLFVVSAYADPHLLRGPPTPIVNSRSRTEGDKQWWWPFNTVNAEPDNGEQLNPYSGFPT